MSLYLIIGMTHHFVLLSLLCRQSDMADLRYDSVAGTYPSCETPIYITYNIGHGYPKYLITYSS